MVVWFVCYIDGIKHYVTSFFGQGFVRLFVGTWENCIPLMSKMLAVLNPIASFYFPNDQDLLNYYFPKYSTDCPSVWFYFGASYSLSLPLCQHCGLPYFRGFSCLAFWDSALLHSPGWSWTQGPLTCVPPDTGITSGLHWFLSFFFFFLLVSLGTSTIIFILF